jgi:hypothetical protein
MTHTEPSYPDEPAQPARGLSRDERGRDVSEAQAAVEASPSTMRRFFGAMSPRFVWSQADGYPVVIKQFLQFCLILIYPAWVFGVLAMAAVYGLFYITIYPLLWTLFWPVRAWMKKNRPEDYAESQKR